MKLLVELKWCYVDYIWKGYRNAMMENILEELGIDETLSPREIGISIEEQCKQLVVKELSMIFGEGGRKLADQLNTQITELHERLPPQLRPFLEDQFDTGYDSDSCDSNGSRDSYDDRKFEAEVTPMLLLAVKKDPCSTKPTSGGTKPEVKPQKSSLPRLPTVLFRPA